MIGTSKLGLLCFSDLQGASVQNAFCSFICSAADAAKKELGICVLSLFLFLKSEMSGDCVHLQYFTKALQTALWKKKMTN